MTKHLLVAAALLFAPLSARAQLADSKVLTLQAAKTALAAAEAEARKNNWNVSIAVVDVARASCSRSSGSTMRRS
jgi:glc operon protein GlcG